MRLVPLVAVLISVAVSAAAQSIAPRDGWVVGASFKGYMEMIAAVKQAAAQNSLGVVTEAGPTEAAAARGITIPGNRVIGLFNNVFAVRILALSTAAMIEAPIRVYVSEQPDGTTVLAYKTPSFVFAPYLSEGGPALAEAAAELDDVFEKIYLKSIN